MSNPRVRYVLRALLVATIAALATLKASVGGGVDASEVLDTVYAFVVAGAAYAGIGAATPLEPSVGVKP